MGILKYQRKKTLLKKCCPPIWLSLFIVRRITLKLLNSSTSIDPFICLGCLVVMHQSAAPEVSGLIPGSSLKYSISKFNILQNLWPIIRVSRYRPSIFKIFIRDSRDESYYIPFIFENENKRGVIKSQIKACKWERFWRFIYVKMEVFTIDVNKWIGYQLYEVFYVTR